MDELATFWNDVQRTVGSMNLTSLRRQGWIRNQSSTEHVGNRISSVERHFVPAQALPVQQDSCIERCNFRHFIDAHADTCQLLNAEA